MSLSVVIPTHDTRDLVVRCLEAVAPQLEGETEVLVVDDGSRDGTAAAVSERFPSVHVLRLGEQQGFTRAVNRGLEKARGDLVLLLNSDTVLEPGALAAACETMAARPEIGALGAQLLDPDGTPQWSGGREPSLRWLFVLASDLAPVLQRLPGYRSLRPLEAASLQPVDWVTGAAMALRRAAFEEAGPLDEEYRFYGQDLDYCCRLRGAGWRVAIEPRFRVLHDRGGTIRQTAATVDGKSLGLLCSDLLLWARKHRRAIWAASAERVLRGGLRLRLVVGGSRASWDRDLKDAWRSEAAAIRQALGQLRDG